jgi:hypothetical protein
VGIENIHILIDPDIEKQYGINTTQQALAAHMQILIAAHRRGEHPVGSMRRDCPMCNPRI